MKKNLAALLLTLAVSAFGQNFRPRMTSEEFYKHNPEVRMYNAQFQSSGSTRTMSLPVTTPQTGPGDHFLGYLYIGDQNFGVGDVAKPRFVMANSSDPYASNGTSIYGRVLMPGPSGQYDAYGSITYIQPDNGSFGYYRGGFTGNETIPLYSLLITPEMNSGEYLFDFSIVDAQTGTLIQQEFARFFVNHTGPTGKGFYSLDGVTTFSSNGGAYATLQGNFPPSSTVNVLSGTPLYQYGQGPFQVDATGHFITFGVSPIAQVGYSGPVQSQDVIVHFPQLRESVTLHNAYSVQASIPTALPAAP